jgi:hypothetical protein
MSDRTLLSVAWVLAQRLAQLGVIGACAYVIFISVQHAFGPVEGHLDLDSFLHAGGAYRQGLNPYGIHLYEVSPLPLYNSINLNPPLSVYFFALLAPFDAESLRVLFAGESLMLFAMVVALLAVRFPEHRRPLSLVAVSALAGLWYIIEYNQIYMPLVAAITGAWLLLERDDNLVAGVLIGLVIAIKPQFGVLALGLFAAGYRAPAVSALATGALLSFVPLLIDGREIYEQWQTAVRDFNGIPWPGNASVVATGDRLGSDTAGYFAGAALAGALLLWAFLTKPDARTVCSAGIVTVILIGPTSWPGYTLFLLPILFSRRWDWRVWPAMTIFVVPQWLVVETFMDLQDKAGSQLWEDLTEGAAQFVANLNVYGMALMLWAVVMPPSTRAEAVDDSVEPPVLELRPAPALQKAG